MKDAQKTKTSYSTWIWLVVIILFWIGLAKGIPILLSHLADTEIKQTLLPFQNEYFSWWAYFKTDSYIFLNAPLVRANSSWRLFFAIIIWLVLMTLIYIPFSAFKNNKVTDTIFRSIVWILFFVITLAVYFLPLRETIIDTTNKVFFVREQPFTKAIKINFSEVTELQFETKRTSTADENYYLITLEVYVAQQNGTKIKLGERPLQEIDIRKENERELYRREPASQKTLDYMKNLELKLNEIIGIKDDYKPY